MDFDLSLGRNGHVIGGRLRRGLELASLVQVLVPTAVRESGRVRQILTNLVANAIKFTETADRRQCECGRLSAFGLQHANIRFGGRHGYRNGSGAMYWDL